MVIDSGAGGRVTVYLLAIYGGIYAQDRGGGFFAGYYMADFTGVNGRIFEKVSKSTRQVLYFGVL